MNNNKFKDVLSEIAIPIAATGDNELINIEFKYECGATLISGKPGTGKSTIIRQMLTYMSKNKEERSYEVFLADTTGYEFSKPNDLPTNIIKGSLCGTSEKNIEEFFDKLYAEFVKKRETMIRNGWYNTEQIPETERMPISVVLIDDIYILLKKFASQKYINKFIELITASWACGFWFVLFCQDYHYAYRVLPDVVRHMIGQKIYLSPYTKKDIIGFCKEDVLDGDIDDNEERFTVVVKKKNRTQLEKGKLFILEE